MESEELSLSKPPPAQCVCVMKATTAEPVKTEHSANSTNHKIESISPGKLVDTAAAVARSIRTEIDPNEGPCLSDERTEYEKKNREKSEEKKMDERNDNE